MNVIAEGVETIEESQYLAQAGCPRMQGFLFHPPLPNSQFRQLLSEQSAGHRPASWRANHYLAGQSGLLFES